MNPTLIAEAEALERQAKSLEDNALYADGASYAQDLNEACRLRYQAALLRDRALSPDERIRMAQWQEAMARASAEVFEYESLRETSKRLLRTEESNFERRARSGASRAELQAEYPHRFAELWARWIGPEGEGVRDYLRNNYSVRLQRGETSAFLYAPKWRQDEIDAAKGMKEAA